LDAHPDREPTVAGNAGLQTSHPRADWEVGVTRRAVYGKQQELAEIEDAR
jgi:hypothetical protein